MSQNEKSVADDAKGRRSPISPMLPIDEAIERARRIYAKDKRAFTDFKTLAGHMGYTVEKKGGTSGRAVSTLKQYGLLDERAGQYRISEAAWKIIEMEEGSEERARLIKEAALTPPMIRKVFNFYDGELPSDGTLKNYLLWTEGFNTDTATKFIKVLRRTKELVNPLPQDYNSGEESEGAETQATGATPMQQTPPPTFTGQPGQQARQAFNPPLSTPPAGYAPAAGESVLAFKISRDSEARVIFSGQVTQEAIDKLAALLNLSKDAYPTQDEIAQGMKAIWTFNDEQKPVKAIGRYYERDGVYYQKILDGDEVKEVPAEQVAIISSEYY